MKGAGGAFLRFHLKVGARIGLRLLAPVLAGLFAVYYLLRPELVLLLAERLLKGADGLRRGLTLSVLTGIFVSAIAPRVTLGLGGWLRHLPASSRRHRALAAAAIWTAATPILVVLRRALPGSSGQERRRRGLGSGRWSRRFGVLHGPLRPSRPPTALGFRLELGCRRPGRLGAPRPDAGGRRRRLCGRPGVRARSWVGAGRSAASCRRLPVRAPSPFA